MRKSNSSVGRTDSTEQQDRAMKAEIGRIVSKSLKEFLLGLDETPHLTLETQDQADLAEERVREVTSWLFKGRERNGTT